MHRKKKSLQIAECNAQDVVLPALEEVFAMKIRIKFSKQGQMKFIGHLDMVRYFQKVMRRAEVDVAYSEGFSPHQKMSFAAPLSVGVISRGEYFDIEVCSTLSSEEMLYKINSQNVEGVEVLSYKLLPDNAKNAMSIVAGADYIAYVERFSEEIIQEFMAQNEIIVLKKTKKSEKEVNIRPMIFKMNLCEEGIFMQIAQGSAANLKPELVIQALAEFSKIKLPELIAYERIDMYCLEDNRLVSLDSIGSIIKK
jgi:radical SAM-linked protein